MSETQRVPVLTLGDSRLRLQTRSVSEFRDSELLDACATAHRALSQFRQAHGFGRAISAPQVGANIRMIACRLNGRTFSMLNPRVTWRSDHMFELWDDCMSFPELLVRVRRHTSISVVYQDEGGCEQVMTALPADESELLQHEIDHLDGVLAVDHALDAGSLVTRTAFERNRTYFAGLVD